MRRNTNRNEGCDPLILQYFFQTSILTGESKLVDERRHNRLVAYRRKLWNVIADFRIGEGRRLRTGEQEVDHEHAFGAGLSQELLNFGNRGDAAWPPLHVARLLDDVDDQERRGLRIKRDTLEFGRRWCLNIWPFVDDGLAARGRATHQHHRESGCSSRPLVQQ